MFNYAKDPKKADGRALGTLVEVITFYLIQSWGYDTHVAIERRLPEYANPDITHNVEFSFHPSVELATFNADKSRLPITAKKLHNLLGSPAWADNGLKSNQLITRDGILRNGCTVYEDASGIITARLTGVTDDDYQISIQKLRLHPFAVVECKRVGVEEGVNKGPQTIEKAKQGAYVARTMSSLQKVRMNDGTIHGMIHLDTGELRHQPYGAFLRQVIRSDERSLIQDFTLTVGIVSNHGNWFTSDNQNKELKVLAESYDWLLFLTDAGLSKFIQTLIVSLDEKYRSIRSAFHQSYDGTAKRNRFTKVSMDLAANLALRDYFATNSNDVENWFNVISPTGAQISELRNQLDLLVSKDWEDILR